MLVALVTAPGVGHAATLPSGFSERALVGGLSMPTAAAWTPDGRMLVAEKEGVVKLVEPGETTAREILDLRSIVHSYWDRGLLGLAVDGQFATNPYVYLLFTYELQPGNPDRFGEMVSQLRRYRLTPTGELTEPRVLLGSYVAGLCPAPSNVVDCIPSEGDSHSIGSVRSAPDGTLYVGSGDGASYSLVDPLALRTYDEQSLAGKIVRIDREGRGLPGHTFCPAETDLAKVCTKLHGKGFRNPFRFELLPGDGGLVVGDVGWGEREEVDIIRTAGGNYGWPCYEGSGRTSGYAALAACSAEYAKEGTSLAARGPAWSYTREGQEGAVIGGPMLTGTRYPDGYAGDVFVADYAQRWVKRLELDESDRVTSVTTFATDWSGVQLLQTPAGELAYVSFGTGEPGTGSVRAISYGEGNRRPTAVATATPASGGAPLTVRFGSSGSTDPDGDALTYRWTFGDGSPATAQAAPEHVYATPGTYSATLTVDDGRGETATDTVTITVGNDPPVPRITAPGDGATFRGGEIIDLAGAATDPEAGDLPDEALSWRVTLHHAGHTHPIVQVAGAGGARFRAVQDHDADSWYEIELTATDPAGLSAKRTVELRPETSALRIESSPAGAPVTYAGRARTAPYAQDAAVGFRTSVSAAERFVRDGRIWEFDRWSDGGARLHDLAITADDLTLTATYRDAGPAVGALKATAASTAFGNVAAGEAATRTVTLRNTGAREVTITGSTPPGGQFALDTPLDAGTVIPPGAEVSRSVRFTATELGEVQGRWRVTADDGSIVSADLTAAGMIPGQAATGWRRNGAARLVDGALELTPATANQRGTAFWPAPVDARRLDVTFDALLTGGTGADGLALVLADPARGATPAALGATGAGLGFSSIPGWAAALVTWKNNGVAAPFAGVSDGPTPGKPGLPRWVATTRDVPPLRTATPSRVRVRIVDGELRLSVNGVQRLVTPVALPDRVLVGFSGSTGGSTDRHVVSNASIGGAPGPALPPPDGAGGGDPDPEPPVLRVTSTVVAPPGSPEESTSIRVAGSCPGTLAPATLTAGNSATPALGGAAAGATCALAQDAIGGDGWSTTVAVNDGAPVVLTVEGGVVRVPAFALRAGVNTVVLTNRYQPPAPAPEVPDPAEGGWQVNGSASVAGSALQLTPASADVKGSAFWPQTVQAEGLTVAFDATVEGGTGADGLALVLGDPSRGATPASLGGGGGSLGFGGTPGWAVALGSYPNGTQATGNFVGLSDGAQAGAWQTLSWLQTSSLLTPLQNTTRRVALTVTAGVVTVTLDGVPVLSRAVALPERVLLGFSAATGGLTNRHAVRNVVVGRTGAPPPPPPAASLRVRSTIVAPAGSPQAGTAVTVTGSCPSAFTASVAAGQSATPPLTGAVRGSSCSVAQGVPAGAGWSTTVAVNGGPPQPLTAVGGVYPVPSFSLLAGENTVAFTSTFTPPSSVPDPAAGGWQLNGSASIAGSALQLTPASADVKGSAFWPQSLPSAGLAVEFDATIDGGTGADGMALVLGDPSRGASPASLGGGGGSLGFGGIPGWGVALSTFANGTQATGNFVGLSDGAQVGAWQTLSWLQTSSLLTPLQNTTRRVRVAVAAGVVTVTLDGVPVLSRAVALPERVLLGFSAGTGGLTNRHVVRDVRVTTPG